MAVKEPVHTQRKFLILVCIGLPPSPDEFRPLPAITAIGPVLWHISTARRNGKQTTENHESGYHLMDIHKSAIYRHQGT